MWRQSRGLRSRYSASSRGVRVKLRGKHDPNKRALARRGSVFCTIRHVRPFPPLQRLFQAHQRGLPTKLTRTRSRGRTRRRLYPRDAACYHGHAGAARFAATGRGAVWLARLTGGQEVAGSNPVAPILSGGAAQHWALAIFEQARYWATGRWPSLSSAGPCEDHGRFKRELWFLGLRGRLAGGREVVGIVVRPFYSVSPYLTPKYL